MSDEPIEVTFFDVTIGIASGWDMYQDNGQVFYDFVPAEKFKNFLGSCTQICLDPFCGAGERPIVIYDNEQEIEINFREFLKLLIAE